MSTGAFLGVFERIKNADNLIVHRNGRTEYVGAAIDGRVKRFPFGNLLHDARTVGR